MKSIRLILVPFVPIYAFVVWIRNLLFNIHILPSQAVPNSICVGNISAGGTGKTPHVSYLIHLLQDKVQLSTISRGYGRKTNGFVLATEKSTASEIGDEPMIFTKYIPKIRVCVDGNRRRALQMIKKTYPETNFILFDDGFQHRYIKPGLSIVLTDFYHPFYDDFLLPAGNLRERPQGVRRADIIVVTKCPRVLSPITRETVLEELKPLPHQSVYFSYLEHGKMRDIHGNIIEIDKRSHSYCILLTGIANPYPLEEHLKKEITEVEIKSFRDHHFFSEKELKKLRTYFNDYYCNQKYVITTEKDLMRMKDTPQFEIIKDLPLCYVPVEVKFFDEDNLDFDKKIVDYVHESI